METLRSPSEEQEVAAPRSWISWPLAVFNNGQQIEEVNMRDGRELYDKMLKHSTVRAVQYGAARTTSVGKLLSVPW